MKISKRWATTLPLLAVLGLSPKSQAANWLMLQGTESPKAPTHRVFGFVGLEYQHTDGSRLPAGPWTGQRMVLNQVPPTFDTNSKAQLSYARIGLRGRVLDGKLNYWISPLFGNNGISQNGTPEVKFTDVSATLNLIPGARLRLGQFKFPGSEEGLQPVVLRDYVNPTNVVNQIVNERYFASDGTSLNDANLLNDPVSGWRDTGIQVFDAFQLGQWEHTYATMAGMGSGLAIYNGTGSGRPEWYLYWSSERLFGGKGPFREGWKLTGWYQDGDREIRAGAAQGKERFDRTRFGLGSTFRRGPWRFQGEWIKADGMIFNGTDGVAVPGSISNNGMMTASFNVLPDNEADGWYLDGGYRFLPKLEARVRYDRLNRGTDSAETERRFETFPVGLTYRFNKHFRLLADYQFREVDAARLSGSAVPNQILKNVDDLFAVRLWAKL